jgi:hypothetical protein
VTEPARKIGRRAFVKAGGSLGALALLPSDLVGRLLDEAQASTGRRQRRRFLNAHELNALRAVCGQLVPGPPTDPDPGAIEAGVPEAIDLLLSAFLIAGRRPRIHAGGPFSNRAGSRRDDFADFVPLDRHARLGWRIRIEGSRGRRGREFAGPVRGLQEIYREGLAHLDERAQEAGAKDFASLAFPAQTAILSDQDDDRVQELLGAALANTLELMYGPPEYGGNRHLVGWRYTGWPGDSQPRGYTNAEVTGPDAASARTGRAKRAVALERFIPGFEAPLGDPSAGRTP